MQDKYLTDEHRMFQDAVRKFVEREIVPYHEQWEKDGLVSREVWRKAGEAGFLCMDVPEAYGGLGEPDYRYNVILAEEMARVGASGPVFGLHNELVVPYFMAFKNRLYFQSNFLHFFVVQTIHNNMCCKNI